MDENDAYRTSTQFRYWTFNPKKLAISRSATNVSAAARVREALGESDRECLTTDEELQLVEYYCAQIISISDRMKFPTSVKVCSAQFSLEAKD